MLKNPKTLNFLRLTLVLTLYRRKTFFNPLRTLGFFLYPLNTLENHWFFYVFWGVSKKTSGLSKTLIKLTLKERKNSETFCLHQQLKFRSFFHMISHFSLYQRKHLVYKFHAWYDLIVCCVQIFEVVTN